MPILATCRYGNPFLLPEYTDGLELGHQLTTKALTVTTSLFYKTTRDVIRRFIEVDDAKALPTAPM